MLLSSPRIIEQILGQIPLPIYREEGVYDTFTLVSWAKKSSILIFCYKITNNGAINILVQGYLFVYMDQYIYTNCQMN